MYTNLAILTSLVPATIFLSGCRTLDAQASEVEVVAAFQPECKELGTVNIDWSWWGVTTESLNVLKNQTARLGGNALLLHGDEIGTALWCPRDGLMSSADVI